MRRAQAGDSPDGSAASSPEAESLRPAPPAWRTRLEQHLARIDLAPDLAEDIGSKRWFRGLGTMLGLAIFALSLFPDFSAVQAAPATRIDREARDEFRSQMIQPLALGGDSGKHSGPSAAVVPLAAAPERPMIQMVATLAQGDSFGRMLQRAGVGAVDAERVSAMLAAVMPLGDITPGTKVDITLGRRDISGQPRPLDQLNFRARFDLDLAFTRQNGSLTLQRRPILVDATPLRIRGLVGSAGIYRSARAAGAPAKAVQQYLQTLDAHLSLEGDILPTDEFDIIVSFKRSMSGESEVGELLYAGLDRGAKSQAALLRWGSEGQFYEASGLGGQQRAASYAPVAGRFTSGFGLRRHPILGYTRMHAGIDFGASYGSPIFAVSDGFVSYAGRHGGHGNYVRLEHGGGMASGYAHMSQIAAAPGSRVRAGQVIGYVGSSGLSTGPHLHFEVYQNGQTVNPLGVRFTMRAEVDEAQLASFKARLTMLKQVKPGAALSSLVLKQAKPDSPHREIERLGGPAAPVTPSN